jgi:hypothetical protein
MYMHVCYARTRALVADVMQALDPAYSRAFLVSLALLMPCTCARMQFEPVRMFMHSNKTCIQTHTCACTLPDSGWWFGTKLDKNAADGTQISGWFPVAHTTGKQIMHEFTPTRGFTDDFT